MKRLLTLLIALLVAIGSFSQNLGKNEAKKISQNFLEKNSKDLKLAAVFPYKKDNLTLFWVAKLKPQGYILISDNCHLRPVYAYSYHQNFDPDAESWKMILPVLERDVLSRINHCDEKMFEAEWKRMTQDYVFPERSFQQWPPAGSTSTGGWLETNWKQSHPYNLMCPMDQNVGSRSIAGCPSVALAMVMNYHQRINNTRLDDSDDYYHSYTNHFWIDDDYMPYGFPSFPELNEYLDSLENNYIGNKPITTNQKAALVFACGVAATQVYSHNMSGTFGLSQSFDAYKRFSYDSSKMIFDSDTSLYRKIADNIKEAMPVHLALLSTTSGGHNLVVDGYNTDEFYHFNFGWGGGSNGWYTMPPTSIPYNLTIVDGAVLDINKEHIGVGMTERNSYGFDLMVYPNPAIDHINIKTTGTKNYINRIRLFTIDGRLVLQREFVEHGDNVVKISVKELSGTYILESKTFDGNIASRRVIIE